MEFPQGDFDPKGNSTKVVGEKKLSKKASVVKEIFMKKRIKEELYDKEKDDKAPATYGVKPKHIKAPEDQEVGDDQAQAQQGGNRGHKEGAVQESDEFHVLACVWADHETVEVSKGL